MSILDLRRFSRNQHDLEVCLHRARANGDSREARRLARELKSVRVTARKAAADYRRNTQGAGR